MPTPNAGSTNRNIAQAPRPAAQLQLGAAARETILADARQAYPHECCGVLIGRREGSPAVVSAHPTANIDTSRAHDRYRIDPREILRLDRLADELGQEILGFYHSHPDHPARPSPTDAEFAWPGYLYLIIALDAQGETDLTAWGFDDNRGEFFRQEIILQTAGPAPTAPCYKTKER